LIFLCRVFLINFIARKNVVSVHETAIKSGLKFSIDASKSKTAERVVFLKWISSSSLSKTGLFSRDFDFVTSESSILISSSNL